MTTVDKLWRIIEPLVYFLGINILVQSICSWYLVGKNIVDSGGALSVATQIMGGDTVFILFCTMIIAIPILIILMKKDEDLIRFKTFGEHYRLIDWSGFFWLIPLGICMCLGLTKLVTLIPLDNILGSYEDILNSYNESHIAFRILVLCILVPVAEELAYRGLFYKRMKEYYDKMIAVFVSAAVFGIVHMNLVQGIYGFISGLILIYVYDRYKSIFAPILLHIAVNTMALISGEFVVFDKINNTFIAKLFFMLLELNGIVGLILVIWRKKKEELT